MADSPNEDQAALPQVRKQMRPQPRILLYAHDGAGLGHIRRLARLAGALQNSAACLVLCGHRQAAWLVPEACEYFHLPSYESLVWERSLLRGKRQFVNIPQHSAIAFRRNLIAGVLKAFSPDAIIVDHLPLGDFEELDGLLGADRIVRFFLTRGVIPYTNEILSERTMESLRNQYDWILVACDRRVYNLEVEHPFFATINTKIRYTGYISEPVDPLSIACARTERNIPENCKWLVCSAGGGALGENLIAECKSLAEHFPSTSMDIVHGSRTRSSWPSSLYSTLRVGNVVEHLECKNLPLLHAAADLVVCSGGYNSLVEAMEGGAPVISVPIQARVEDEQFTHSKRLSTFYPISVVSEMYSLQQHVSKHLQTSIVKQPIRETRQLDFRGIQTARDIILSALLG